MVTSKITIDGEEIVYQSKSDDLSLNKVYREPHLAVFRETAEFEYFKVMIKELD